MRNEREVKMRCSHSIHYGFICERNILLYALWVWLQSVVALLHFFMIFSRAPVRWSDLEHSDRVKEASSQRSDISFQCLQWIK